jgi:hypothetical protein
MFFLAILGPEEIVALDSLGMVSTFTSHLYVFLPNYKRFLFQIQTVMLETRRQISIIAGQV